MEKKKILFKGFLISHPPPSCFLWTGIPDNGKGEEWEEGGEGRRGGGEGRIVEKQRKVTQHSRASGSSTSIATITSSITSALTSNITSIITSSVISPITSLLFTDSLRAPPSLLAAGPILSTLLNFYFLPVSLKVKLMKKSAFPHGRADRFFQKRESMIFEKMYCMTASFRLHCTLRISAERQLKYVKTSAYAQNNRFFECSQPWPRSITWVKENFTKICLTLKAQPPDT